MTIPSQTPGVPDEHEALVALARREIRAGRLAEAAEACRKILASRPGSAEAHNDLGSVLVRQGKLDEAAAQFERAVALKPGLFQAHHNLANLLRDQGKFEQAVARYLQVLAVKPDLVDVHNNLGIIFAKHGKLARALAWFEQAIALRPNYAEGYNNLGNVLLRQGKLDEAAARYEQALALKPDYAVAHNNLGNIFWEQGKFDQAVSRFEQALALRPDYAEAHNNLSNILWRQGKFEQALTEVKQALALRPNYAEAHNSLGNVLLRQDKLAEAAACYEQALALRPDFAEAHNNLANTLKLRGKLDEAAARYEQALAFRPNYGDAQIGLAACYLIRGDYERGWPAYEGRLRIPGFVPQHSLQRWTGEPLAGRSVLLVAEQGFGDTLHFVRYARLLKERGARVVLAAQAALGPLLASHRDVDELFMLGSAEELPRCDFYLPLLSAPAEFRTGAATIPSEIPYLWADPDLMDQWLRELSGIEGFKIGIAWQGARDYVADWRRSIPLAHFAPLASLPGVRLLSLQKGFGAEQIATVDFPVLDLSGRLDQLEGPFMDTAAVIRNLDLVVTSDTAIAHLAGALGVPVWVALQHSPEWRWLQNRDDSPWYPTMRLFRQTAFGQWPDVFERIADAVRARRSEKA